MLRCFSTFRGALLFCLLGAVFLIVCAGANVYYAPGWHGGYFLTNEMSTGTPWTDYISPT
jgi:hypothetical protein